MTERTCSIDGCVKPTLSRGWCGTHYRRWWKGGDPLKVQQIRGDDIARLMSHVRIDPSGCWIWTGSLNREGYGRISWRGRTERAAHRVSYALLRGPLLEGLELDHLCRVRPCVNPDHLEQVTSQVNILRGKAARDSALAAVSALADLVAEFRDTDLDISDAWARTVTIIGLASFEMMPAVVPQREGARV